MGANDYQSLLQQIHRLQPWQIIALGATCAEKVRPVVRFLALPTTWELARAALNYSWAAIQSSADVGEGGRLAQALESTPEWRCEYPDSLPFVAAKALNFYQAAVRTVTTPSVNEKADLIDFSSLLEFAELFDLALEDYPQLDVVKQRIVTAEETSQQVLVEMVQAEATPSPALIEALRGEAGKIAGLFEKGLPVYSYHYVLGAIRAEQGQ